MPAAADRRPWLIISRREAEALLLALVHVDELTPEMKRAGAQLQGQLAFISGYGDDAPSVERALERERAYP